MPCSYIFQLENVEVVGTADDYESDRAKDKKWLEEKLQDLDDSFTQMEGTELTVGVNFLFWDFINV